MVDQKLRASNFLDLFKHKFKHFDTANGESTEALIPPDSASPKKDAKIESTMIANKGSEFESASKELDTSQEVQTVHDDYLDHKNEAGNGNLPLSEKSDLRSSQKAESKPPKEQNKQEHVDAADFQRWASDQELSEKNPSKAPAESEAKEEEEKPAKPLLTVEEVLSLIEKNILPYSGREIFEAVILGIIKKRDQYCPLVLRSAKIYSIFMSTKSMDVTESFGKDRSVIRAGIQKGISALRTSEYETAKSALGIALDKCYKNLDIDPAKIVAEEKVKYTRRYPYAIRVLITELHLFLAYAYSKTGSIVGLCEYLDHAIFSCPVGNCRSLLAMFQGMILYDTKDYSGQFSYSRGLAGRNPVRSCYWMTSLKAYAPNIMATSLLFFKKNKDNKTPLIHEIIFMETIKHALLNGDTNRARIFAKRFARVPKENMAIKQYLTVMEYTIGMLYTYGSIAATNLAKVRGRPYFIQSYFDPMDLAPEGSVYSQLLDSELEASVPEQDLGKDFEFHNVKLKPMKLTQLEADTMWIASSSAYVFTADYNTNKRLVLRGDRVQPIRAFTGSAGQVWYGVVNWTLASAKDPPGSPRTLNIVPANQLAYQPYATILNRLARLEKVAVPLPLPAAIIRLHEYMNTTYVSQRVCICHAGPAISLSDFLGEFPTSSISDMIQDPLNQMDTSSAITKCSSCKLPAFETESPLIRCLIHRDIPAALEILKLNPDLDLGPVLSVIARQKYPATARFLISYVRFLGVDIDLAVNAEGQTILHQAVMYRYSAAAATLLMEEGANVNSRDNKGETPLAYVKKRRWTVSDTMQHAVPRIECRSKGSDYEKVTRELKLELKKRNATL